MAYTAQPNRGSRGGRGRPPTQPVQAQVIPPPQQPQQQQQHRFNSAAQMNANMMFPQPPVFYQAGAGLMPQGQPVLHPTYSAMFHPHMMLGGGQPRQPVVMFQHQQFPPTAHMPAMPYGAARHDLPTAQAPSQKYHQQPQQPSTQLQPKAQSTTKRATKALLIVDPDTNKPLDLVGVSSSSKSKSPEPASVTSPTQDAKRVEFMEKISRTSATTDASAPEPSPSTQQGEAAQQLPEGTSVKDSSVLDGSLRQGAQPQLGEQSQTAEQLQPAAPTQPVEQSKSVEKSVPVPQPDEKPVAVMTPQPVEKPVAVGTPKPAEAPKPDAQPQPVGGEPKMDAQPQPVGGEPKMDAQPEPVENLQPAEPAKASLPLLAQPKDASKLTAQEVSGTPPVGETGVQESMTTVEVMGKPVIEAETIVEPEKLSESRKDNDQELKQPVVELSPADETLSTDVAVTKESSTDAVDDLALLVSSMSMRETCTEAAEEDWETEMTDVPQPSGEKAQEVTPPVEPFVTTSETRVETTEDWDAETTDVPEQVQERDQLEDWVILESAQASSVEPGEVEKVDVDEASVCKVDEPKEKAVPEMKTKTAAEQSNVGEVEACDSESQLALTAEKVDANKVEEKRNQLPQKTEEEKEEGEITSDDEPTENVNEGGHTEQEAGGRKKYNREHLLSFRFLKECMEPPEGLFLPGAIGLVRKTGGDAMGPMSGGFPRDQREDRHTGRDKRSHSRSGGGAPMRKPSQQLKVIDVPTHEKVELRKADVAWKRTSEVSMEQTEEQKEAQDLYRKFQGILNKLTPQKFQKLAEQAKELMSTAATTQEKMSGCIEKIFLKALEEPVFSVAYAKLCLVLAGYKIKVGENDDGTPKMKSFRALLLTKCQEEFEKDKKDDEELDKLKQAMEEAQTDEERKQRKDVFEEADFRARHRSLGNIRFIGELFKLKLLSEAIMHECIMRLLRSSSDGESLECFAKLMSTIGKEMDHDKGKNLMEKYFNRVSHVIEAKKIDSRVRFMLQDLVDLRQNAWVPRKLVATNVPTTIDKIHEQAKKEEMEMQKRIASQPMMGRPRGGGDRSRGRDEWSSAEHSRAPAPSTRIDAERFTRVLNSRAAGPTPRFGPPPGGWGKSQAARAHSPSKYDTQKYQGRNSKGKRDSKTSSDPPPAGPRRSSSQPSDANAKRSILEAVAKQTGGKLVEQAPPTETVVSDALSDEEVERKSKTIVGELSSNGDYKEAQLCVSELRSPGKLHLFVYTVLNHTMEKTSKDRQVAGVLLNQLLTEGVLPLQAFMKGLNDVLEFAEDYECDIPKFWDYIAELLAPSVAHKGFPLVTLKQAHEGPLEGGKIGKLVAKILCRCTSLEGVTEDQVYGVWSQSGLEWSTHLHVPPEDLGYLLEDHKLTFLTQRPPARQSSSSSGQSQTGRGDPKDWSHVLEEQLGSNQTTNDDVFKFMESKHATEYRSPLFIFSLSSALTQAVVRGKGDSAVFSEDLFRKRCEVLKKCVEGVPELQLQVIYGIQVVLSQKQHPKDVMCNMFNQLYDDDVVSDDTFYHWEESGREDLEGREVALVVAKNFLQWLRSAGEEEGEGTGQ